ncbi:MAG: 23S rRNA (uracil(1939)-C(5))-methyltransferase RlmD [Faecalibacterium sp.]|nr:23S rRNA (uracil(1939)-C(5))-methyltransferase RlmD [Faecalibacterium sp.]
MTQNCPLRQKNCGGCPLLSMPYPDQLAAKRAKLVRLVGKYGPVRPVQGMADPMRYRNKAIATFARGPKGSLVTGIYAQGSHRVLPTEQCLLQHDELDKTIQAVRAAAQKCRYEAFDEDKGAGLVRHVLVRRGAKSGQIMVVLVTGQPTLPGARNFVNALLAEAAQRGVTVTTVVQNVNSRQTSAVLGSAEKVLYGKGFIVDTLCGKTFAISPRSFYQVNSVQTELLYSLAIKAAGLTGKETVIDAYCGIGTIGLAAAPHAKQVIGVERNPDAVRDAVGNAKHNGVKNARFIAADATQWILEAAQAGQKADVIFMDPPREGSTPEFIQSVVQMAPRTVVYVSCGPESLARDLELFVKKGYKAEYFIPVDMFPHTNHIECIARLVRATH